MGVIMATNLLELATTLKYLVAKWLLEKKVNFTPCVEFLDFVSHCKIAIVVNYFYFILVYLSAFDLIYTVYIIVF